MDREEEQVKTYIAVVELPKALPAQGRRVSQTFLHHRVKEGQHKIDTSLLNRLFVGLLRQ